NCAKSLLAKRCLKTDVSLPSFSEKSARLHFVPPTSPARITYSPRHAATLYRYPVSKSWIEPFSAVAFEQQIGFVRAPASRGILGDLGGSRSAPYVENRIDERPRGLHVIAAIEKCSVAAQAIVDQRGISAARCFAKTFLVAEVHVDVSDAHLSSWTLGAEGNGDALFGLYVENETVRLDGTVAEHDVRSAAELNHDFCAARGETFAGAQVKGHAGPAPIVDQQPSGDKCFRARCLADSRFLAIPR